MQLHSETILGLILYNNNIIVKYVHFRFVRIWCNGNVENKDLCI